MSDIAIKVEDLGKLYRLGEIGTGTLSHDLNRWWARVRGKEDPFAKIGEANDRTTKGNSEYVWSLKDVNFEVKQGEVLGIIGRNGAGKSTLLKILSKVTAPTTGRIKIKGRIASLLEVGTGFHPELTGRENIFLNGAILGMTKSEIRAKFDEIVDFSGVERYIDTPVKRYSSGMYVRLAFAVAAFLEPEILILDEVLAVGDAEFQKKCLGRMKDVSVNDGRTVLFVSHNLTAVQNLCSRSLHMELGKVKNIGKTADILDEYLGNVNSKTHWRGIDGNEIVKVKETRVYSDSAEVIYSSKRIFIFIKMEITADIRDIVIGFNILSSFGQPISRSSYNDFNDYREILKGSYIIKFEIPEFMLATGAYKIVFDIAIPHVEKINTGAIDLGFEVFADQEYGNKYFVENSMDYNSIIRTNWFVGIEKL